VLVVDGEWRMYYTGSDGTTAAVGLATSTDGVTWTKQDTPLLTPQQAWWDSGSIGCPQVVATDDGFVMTYDAAARGAFGVGLATSADGVDWTAWPANPLVTQSTAPGAQQIWQSELVAVDGDLRWFVEVGPGASRTDVYAFGLARGAIDNPPDPELRAEATVSGENVVVRVTAIGLGLGFEEGGTERRLVHPHVFVDRDPPADGELVPLDDPSIVHSTRGTVSVRGLTPGEHTLWVVAADGADRAVVPPEPVRIDVTIEP
jgi:hypothetical protein